MPRPELYPIKKVIGFEQAMIDAVEKWRAKQKPIPTVSDAIRQLVHRGISTFSPPGRTSARSVAQAAHMAGKEIDQRADQSASVDQRAQRKRRLLKGPKEFRDIRGDHKR